MNKAAGDIFANLNLPHSQKAHTLSRLTTIKSVPYFNRGDKI